MVCGLIAGRNSWPSDSWLEERASLGGLGGGGLGVGGRLELDGLLGWKGLAAKLFVACHSLLHLSCLSVRILKTWPILIRNGVRLHWLKRDRLLADLMARVSLHYLLSHILIIKIATLEPQSSLKLHLSSQISLCNPSRWLMIIRQEYLKDLHLPQGLLVLRLIWILTGPLKVGLWEIWSLIRDIPILWIGRQWLRCTIR